MKTINKIIASASLSSLLMLAASANASAKENFNLNNRYDLDLVYASDSRANLDFVSETDSKNFSSLQLAHNSYMIYQDIFEQTKPAIKLKNATEDNQIAKKFFDEGLWDLCYFSAVGGMLLGNYILNSIDKSGKLSIILNNLISLAEMRVIIKNNQIFNQDIQINIPLFYKTF